jgi:hypothetical protein
MSDSETGDSETGPSDAQTKTEQLLREVFRPVFSRNSTASKRERPLHGYKFRKEAKKAASDGDLDEFTPRCLRKTLVDDLASGIVEQQLLVQQSVTVSDADWTLYASYLSPTLLHKCKPPLHPNTCTKSAKPTCRFELPCWCIACAGIHTKPRIASCMVCAAEIPYSVCNKTAVTTPPSQLPSMCFACRCAFEE